MVANYFLGAFLVLHGLMGLIPSALPRWPLYVLAIIAGILVIVFGLRNRKRSQV